MLQNANITVFNLFIFIYIAETCNAESVAILFKDLRQSLQKTYGKFLGIFRISNQLQFKIKREFYVNKNKMHNCFVKCEPFYGYKP